MIGERMNDGLDGTAGDLVRNEGLFGGEPIYAVIP
jgi:hypothetical protein